MALFKINKGSNTQRLTNPNYMEGEENKYIQPKDGYCYFDTSTGLFFIDAENENGDVVRAPLNASRAIYDAHGESIDQTYVKFQHLLPHAIGLGYGECRTEADSLQKEVTIADFTMRHNCLFLIKFFNAVNSNSRLKVNDLDPLLITFNQAVIDSGIIKAGDTCLFRHDDNNYDLIAINKDIIRKANLASPQFTGIPTVPTPDLEDNSIQVANTIYVNSKIRGLIDNASEDYNTLKKIEDRVKEKADNLDVLLGELIPPPTIGNGILTIKRNNEEVGSFTANAVADKSINIAVPTDLGQLTNSPGYKTTDHNTTYTISGVDRTITLTPSEGAATSYTIPEYLPITGGTIKGNIGNTPLILKSASAGSYLEFIDSTGVSLGKYGFNTNSQPVVFTGNTSELLYHTGNLDLVTEQVNGLMSAEDKQKLDSIEANATKYEPPTYTEYGLGFYTIKTNVYGHITDAIKVNAKDITDTLGFVPAREEHTHMYAGSASEGGPANSVAHTLKFTVGGESKGSYNGSEEHTIDINAFDLNISGALKYIGRTNENPETLNSQGATTVTLVSGTVVPVEVGNVVIYTAGNIEYLYDNDRTWIKLGDASSFSLAPHIHGNVSNQGYLTDGEGNSLPNRLLISDGTGFIGGHISFSTGDSTQKFLNENGTWQAVNGDNFYHKTGSWGGSNNLTYTALAEGGAPELAFTLPIASGTSKGVVSAGSNITIENGVISLTADNIASAIGYAPLSNLTTYALSDEVGGAALEAKKLSSNGGTKKLPVYFENGIPTPIDSEDVAISIAGSAEKWKTARTITVTGDVEGEITLDGSQDIEANLTLAGGGAGGEMLREDMTVLTAASEISVPIVISEFLTSMESYILLVYQNGLLLNLGENYTVNDSCTVVSLVDYSCEAGDTFTFIGISSNGFNLDDLGEVPYVLKSGGVMQGALTLAGDPVEGLHAATKQYVDNKAGDYVLKTGDTMTGSLTTPTLTLSSTSGEGHLKFSRTGSPNYIQVPTDGSLGICCQDSIAMVDCSALIYKTQIRPGTTAAVDLGTSTYKWNNVYMTKGWGAVWNDYAEYRQANSTEPGRCIIEVGDDTLALATKRMQPGASIISDTFGFAIGETDEARTPIAVSGRVLAYGYEDREEFRKAIGRPVCSGPDGTVSIMTDEEYQRYGYCAIGTVSAVPNYETWGSGNVPVNGRIWIKVV